MTVTIFTIARRPPTQGLPKNLYIYFELNICNKNIYTHTPTEKCIQHLQKKNI